MGYYLSSGFVSKLNIRCNDDIIAIPCMVKNGKGFNRSNYFTTSQLEPLSLPIFGKYDDYGSVRDIEVTPSAKAWAKCVSYDIKGSLRVFERASVYEYTLKEIFDKEKDFDGNKTYEKYEKGILGSLKGFMNVCLILEHRKVYEELASKADNMGNMEYFSDVARYKKMLLGITSYKPQKIIPFANPFILDVTSIDYKEEELDSIVNTAKALSKKHRGSKTIDSHLFNGENTFCFNAYDESVWRIDGIAKAFTDFGNFNREIMRLNIGYNVPSCNCGSQNDFNHNIIAFNKFLEGFYNNELKDDEEYDEED